MAVNWGQVGSGAISGAGTGASVGGPWGALVGGLVGAGTGALSGGGENETFKNIPTGTQQQQQVHNNILSQSMGMSQGNGGYNLANQHYNNLLGPNQQEAYDQFSAPYLQDFEQNILPMIAERFAGAGALSSSGFGQAVGGAGAGLQSQLAKLFSSLQNDAAQSQYGQYNQLNQTGLNYSPFDYEQKAGSKGLGGSFAEGISGNMENILSGIMSLFKKKDKGGLDLGAGIGGVANAPPVKPGNNTSGKHNLPTYAGL